MTFKKTLAADMVNFFNTNDFADIATYTPIAGSPISIKVIMQYGMEQSPGRGGISAIADALVSRTDVALPAYGDIIAIDTDIWKVIAVTAKDSCVFHLALRKEKSERPVYR